MQKTLFQLTRHICTRVQYSGFVLLFFFKPCKLIIVYSILSIIPEVLINAINSLCDVIPSMCYC